MSAKTVTNTLTLPNGQPAAGAKVTISLVASTSGEAEGFTTAVGVAGRSYVTADQNGTWSAQLLPNAEIIAPAGSLYRIVEQIEQVRVTSLVIVPTSAGPFKVGDILAVQPTALVPAGAARAVDLTAETTARINADIAEAAARVAGDAAERAFGSATYATFLTDTGSGYPARPVGVPAGRVLYRGATQPSDWLTGDGWFVQPAIPKPVIWDTDWYTDVDDVVAARILAYYERIGTVDVLASIVDTIAAAGATSLDAFFRTEGRVMQIGQVDYNFSDLNAGGPYQANLNSLNPHYALDSSQFPSALTVYRTMLAQSPAKVDIISVGYLGALQQLLASPADSISPLTGVDLIAAKVNRLWIMGGAYPSGSENNFNRSAKSIAAAAAVVNGWSSSTGVPITFLGFEVGSTVISGGHLSMQAPTTDPLYKALVDHGSGTGRSSWDPMMTMLACVGDPTALGYTTVTGTNTVNVSTGANSFSAGAGPHTYVVKNKSDAAFAADLNALLVKGRQPEPPTGLLTRTSDGVARPYEYRDRKRGLLVPQITGSTDISGPAVQVARLRATDYAGADGSSVSAVSAGGVGPSWAQATGARQPVYRASIGGRAAFQFSGAQALGAVSNTTGISTMTVLARVRWDTLPTSNQTPVSMDNNGAGAARGQWHLTGITGAKAQANVFSNGNGVLDQVPGLVAGQWHVLALRHTATSIEVLIDGVSDGPAAATNGFTVVTTAVSVGASVFSTLAEPVTGYISDVMVCTGYASDSQIATLSALLV